MDLGILKVDKFSTDRNYSAVLESWIVTAPAYSHVYNGAEFSGYADENQRNRLYTAALHQQNRISRPASIVHDDAIAGRYAALYAPRAITPLRRSRRTQSLLRIQAREPDS